MNPKETDAPLNPLEVPPQTDVGLGLVQAARIMSSPFALKPLKPLPVAPGAIRQLAVPLPKPMRGGVSFIVSGPTES